MLILAAVGALLLLIFVAAEYRLSGYRNVVAEVAEHVILPLLLIAAPMALAGRWVIRRSLAPLDRAALEIEAAGSADRGFRVPTRALPEETLPFVSAVNRLLSRLDEAATRHEAFAADVAHELKTPLAVLNLELDGLAPSDADRLRRQVRAMTRLIDQLMLIAQLDADRLAGVERAPVSLRELASDVVEMVAPFALSEGKQVHLNVLGDTRVPARREAIGSALRNLIENSLHVSPAGGIVTVRVGPGPAIAVQDQGPGLDEAQLARLQGRHERADHRHNGAGLGLAIVSAIMADHGGAVLTDPECRELRLQFGQSDEGES